MHKFGVGADRPSMDPMERRRQRSVIRRKAINFTKIVSLVGIRHATDSKNSIVRRVVWILWLMFGTGFAFHQIIERMQEYRAYLLRTDLQFITDQARLQFPQVTLCNDNPAPKASKPVDDVLTKIDENYKNMKDAEKKEPRNRKEFEDKLKGNLQELRTLTSRWEEQSKNFSMSALDAFLEATFDHESFPAQEVLTDMGYCYAFSTKDNPYYSSKGGSSNGLYFVLRLGHTKFDKYPGYKMLIHDPHVEPRFKGSSAVIDLNFQTLTRVAISYENILYEGPPYYDCNDTDENYRTSNCLAVCDEKVTKSRCGCRDVYMKNDPEKPVCSYGELLSCTQYFPPDTVNSTTDLEGCSCARECNTSTYKTSAIQMPSLVLEKEVLSGYVFYPSITYTKSENVPAYLFFDLLGDIGGALSLLLGATILTVYEVCEFIVLAVKDYVLFQFSK